MIYRYSFDNSWHFKHYCEEGKSSYFWIDCYNIPSCCGSELCQWLLRGEWLL